jgi:hypothetical protein
MELSHEFRNNIGIGPAEQPQDELLRRYVSGSWKFVDISEWQEEETALAPAMDSSFCFPQLAILQPHLNYGRKLKLYTFEHLSMSALHPVAF